MRELKIDINAMVLIFSTLLVKILGMLYKVPLSYILGDEGMGYFNSAYTVYGILYIVFSTGVPKAVTMQISGKVNSIEKRKILSLYLKVFIIIAIIVFTIFLMLARPFSLFMGVDKCYLPLLAISPSILFMVIGSLMRGYLIGMGRISVIAVSQLVEAACKLVLGIAFAVLGRNMNLSLEEVCALTILGISAGTIISVLIMLIASKTRNTSENIGQTINLDKRILIKDMLKKALPITFSALAINISGVMDLGLFLRIPEGGTFDGVAMYGNYSTLALPMFNLVVSLISPLTISLLPRLCEAFAKKDNENYTQAIKECINSTMLITSAAVAILTLYSFDRLDVLFSSQASVQGYTMLSYLSLSLLLYAPLSVINTIHEAEGRLWVPIISLTLGSVIKLFLGGLLISIPSIGINGVPISGAISFAVSL